MTHATAQIRHTALSNEIRGHDHAYYVEGRQRITDREYDRLFKELQDLEKQFPDLATPESPTQRVGGAPSEKFTRVRHLQPMLSLDKIEASDHPTPAEEPDRDRRNRLQDQDTLAALRAFDATLRKQLGRDTLQYILEPKVDGVSLSVHYRQGKFSLGVTRGDGTEGDDITANLTTVRGIPLELDLQPPPALLEVRGEAYISIQEFEAMNRKSAAAGEKAFPNARNATAGTLKQLDPRQVAQRPLRAVFYAVGAVDGLQFKTHSEMLEALARFGLPTQKLWWVCDGIEQVLKIYEDKVVAHYDEAKDLRRQLPYEIDGIVLKLNTLADWARIPGRSRAPGYAIVHKPVPWITPAETRLKAITVQVGRTGVLTPVAELEPVFVQGSTVARATLHNEDEIRRKDLRIGDTVVIRKAGMVIPEVFEVVKTKRPPGAEEFDLYRHVGGRCPACGGPIAKDKTQTSRGENRPLPRPADTLTPATRGGEGRGEEALDDEVAWRCQNIAGCPAQLTRRVEYFAQRKALDIESLGGIVAEKLVERGLVKEPLDLFDLKREGLSKLNLGTDHEPRTLGEKNATKILEALQRAKTAPLSRWIFAIGIPNVGEVTAIDIAKYHNDLEKVAESQMLEGIKSLGDLYAALLATSPFVDNISEDEKSLRQELFKKKKQELLDLGNQLVKKDWVQKSGNWTKLEEKGSKAVPKFLPVVDYVPAENVLAYFASKLGKNLLHKLHQLGIHPRSSLKAPTNEKLFGKTFVLTGTLPTMSRDEASVMIRDAGGSVTGSISKNTDFLLTGESAGSKLEKAKQLGVKIIFEADFLKLLESSKPEEKITHKTKQSELF